MCAAPIHGAPERIRIRIGLGDLAARRLLAHRAASFAQTQAHDLQIWTLTPKNGTSLAPAATLLSREAPARLSLQVRPVRPSRGRHLLSPGEADGDQGWFGVETDGVTRDWACELNTKRSAAFVPPALPERLRTLVENATGTDVTSCRWDAGPALVESLSHSRAAGIPVYLRRWVCPDLGVDALELQASASPADSAIVLAILTSYLRRSGVDPRAGTPWLEARMGPGRR